MARYFSISRDASLKLSEQCFEDAVKLERARVERDEARVSPAKKQIPQVDHEAQSAAQ